MKLSLALSTVIIGNAVCGTIANGVQETVDPFLTNEDDRGHVSIERSLQFEMFDLNYTLGKHACLFNFTGPLVSVDEIVCTQELDAPDSATVTATLSGGNCTNMLLSPPGFLSATASRPSNSSAVSLIQFSTIPVPALQGDVSLTEFCLMTILKEDGFDMFYMKTPISVEFEYDGTFEIVVDTSFTDTVVEAVANAIDFSPVSYMCNPDFTATDALLPLGGVLYVCIVPNPDYKDIKVDRATSFDVIQHLPGPAPAPAPVSAQTPAPVDQGSSPVQAPNSNSIPQLFFQTTSGTCSSNGYKNIYSSSDCVEAVEGIGSSFVSTYYDQDTTIVDGCSLEDGDLYINSDGTCEVSVASTASCECSNLNPCFCQKDCVVCSNIAPPRGINGGIADGEDCYTAPQNVFQRRCKNNSRWKENLFCMLSCFNEGYSYAGVVCCDAPVPNVVTAKLITDGIPNPTTIVVTGAAAAAVEETPVGTVTLSQISRGIIIGTRMPSTFFDSPAQVFGSGEVQLASVDRRLRSKIEFSRNLQGTNDSSGFGLEIGLMTRKINSGNALASTFFDMNR
eukprot:CAMPEP_0194272630 /NCGR_PEP_ID=MMETSP0169-20130528/6143_1 /TAXON_ID=218684 /ORGANISM="Corethron pennatum, Strain L29A3" /LENGTH=563 /DNA_ID=CAMNT_0039015337 /DNA_START=56 /DNA_END=1744 /DNA_ORIENTATION=+